MPAGHDVHPDAPLVDENVPVAHDVQLSAAVRLKVPLEHAGQLEPSWDENVPAAQILQIVLWFEDVKRPPGHRTQ